MLIADQHVMLKWLEQNIITFYLVICKVLVRLNEAKLKIFWRREPVSSGLPVFDQLCT